LWSLKTNQNPFLFNTIKLHTFVTSVGAQRRRVNGSAAAFRCSCASR
jgi:hypothetical protein